MHELSTYPIEGITDQTFAHSVFKPRGGGVGGKVP